MRRNANLLLVLLLAASCQHGASTSANSTALLPNRSHQLTAAPTPTSTQGVILFTGIVTLEHTSGNPVRRVILPRVTPGRARACRNDVDCDIPSHEAFIVIDTSKFHVDTSLSGEVHGDNTIYFLSGSVPIEVADLQGSAVAPVDAAETGDTGHHTKGNLYYIPHLRLINKKVCRPAQIQFNAKIDTPAGSFRSYVVHDAAQSFTDASVSPLPVHSQCVAEIAEWSFTVAPSANGIPTISLLSNGEDQLMKITHVRRDDPDPIVLVIGNANQKNVRQAVDGASVTPMARDPHFDIYYNRCDPSDLSAFPIPGDGSGTCAVDPPAAYFPRWMKPPSHVALASIGKASERDLIFHPFMVGGFDCGPDQIP